MGLDMYLHDSNGYELVYWRKANQIHGWFVANCARGHIEDCEEVDVTLDDLRSLVSDCNEVINSSEMVESRKTRPMFVRDGDGKLVRDEHGRIVSKSVPLKRIYDTSVAARLLPVQSGFFFGSTEYDEYYVDELRRTAARLQEVIDYYEGTDTTFTYMAWW